MEEYKNVLLDVWREACRHIEITQSTETIAALLASHLPIDRVVVRHIDGERSCLETVAVGPSRAGGHGPEVRTECSPGRMNNLLDWCRKAG